MAFIISCVMGIARKMKSNVYLKAIEKVLRKKKMGRCDFHTHTFLTDGELLPMELIRRCQAMGYSLVAITDHVSFSNYEQVCQSLSRDCLVATQEFGILAIPGVEITHVPPKRIGELAKLCKEAGALLVVVHGETMVEPVLEGTNKAASHCSDVDILAHPGLITAAECRAAKKRGIFIEITSRKGHSLSNGHVVNTGRIAGCEFLINTDAHSPSDLIDLQFAENVGTGAGMTSSELKKAMERSTRILLKRIRARLLE
jgi:histidinol phosphatase-like PHP family hydrolase